VPRNMLTIEFAELLPKLLAEFWPAVRDDVEDVPAETPASVEAVTFTVNDKRAPKNGSLADIVEEDEDLDICVVIKGADDIPGLWIPIETVTPVAAKKEGSKTPYTSNKKRKSTASVKIEGDAEGEDGDPDSNRRKIKRWDPAETNLLLALVVEHGKGKWKRVLELGEGTFDRHRTTVDLKDKWRNLEKSGVAPQLPDNLETRRTPGSRKKKAKQEETAVGTSMQALANDAAMTTGASEQLIAAVVAQQPGLLAQVTSDPAMAAFTSSAPLASTTTPPAAVPLNIPDPADATTQPIPTPPADPGVPVPVVDDAATDKKGSARGRGK